MTREHRWTDHERTRQLFRLRAAIADLERDGPRFWSLAERLRLRSAIADLERDDDAPELKAPPPITVRPTWPEKWNEPEGG